MRVSSPIFLPLAAVLVAGLAACDDQALPEWPEELTACDPREVGCAEQLARGLAVIHGAPWPADIEVEIVEAAPRAPDAPFEPWNRRMRAAPTLFDALDYRWPALPIYAGSVRLFGDRKLQFVPNARVDGDDAALRHRLGFIRGLTPHLRGRVWPAHPMDQSSAWPTRSQARSALRTATAYMIEQAIQRADKGGDPWYGGPGEVLTARAAWKRDGAPEALALMRLYERHDRFDPRATLLDIPAELGATCLLDMAFGAPARCVEVALPDAVSEIGDFLARRVDAADAILLREALIHDEHPAAEHVADLVAHLGRTWNRPDGAAARQDVFVFPDSTTAATFAGLMGQALDADDGWTSTDAGWQAPAGDDDDPHAGGAMRVVLDGARVTRVAVSGGVDPTPFLDAGIDIEVIPLADPIELADLPCDTPPAELELPCDVRQKCCRDRLVTEAQALLGETIPNFDLRVFDPDVAVATYIGPRWAADRLSDRVNAEVRFAVGIDRELRLSNDETAEARARRVLAWYRGIQRQVVMIVPTDPDAERDLLRENSTLVHELTHAWQDARFGLTASRLSTRTDPGDREAALQATFEGHANLVSTAFEVVAAGARLGPSEWFEWADELIGLIAPALDAYDEPAVSGEPWLPYVGGEAVLARLAAEGETLAGIGLHIADPPATTSAILGAMYGLEAAEPDAHPLPTGDDELAEEDVQVQARRARVGAWALALRLTADVGAEAAIDAVLGLTDAREVVTLHPDEGTAFWFEARVAFGDDALADALDAFGLALATRQGLVHRLQRTADTVLLVIAADEAGMDRLVERIE